MIRVLAELGAGQIVLDFIYSEPSPNEIRDPRLDDLAGADDELEIVGELSPRNLIRPDEELARAIADAGNVYLPFIFSEDAGEVASGKHRVRIDPATGTVVTPPLPGDPPDLSDRAVALSEVSRLLKADPKLSLRDVHERVLTTPFGRKTIASENVRRAYDRHRSERRLAEALPELPADWEGRVPIADDLVPPIEILIPGAAGFGAVRFSPDSDGSLRRISLLHQWHGQAVEQLGFAAAYDALNVRPESLRIEHGRLMIPARGERKAMNVPADSPFLIPWHVGPSSDDWRTCFAQLPVLRVMEIVDVDRNMRENETRRAWAVGRVMRLINGDEGFALYRDQVNRMLRLEREVYLSRLRGESDAPETQARASEASNLRDRLASDERETMTLVREEWQVLREEDPDDPTVAADYASFREAHQIIVGEIEELERVNDVLTTQRERLAGQLRPIFDARMCFVGYTATALADMVTTPGYSRAPGVLVHAQVANGLLQGRVLRHFGLRVQLAAILILGAMATIMSVWRGPVTSLVSLLVVTGILSTAAVRYVFAQGDHWVPLVTPVVGAFVVWAMVLMFRLLVTDRQRRRLARAVSQYVSPAMARQIAAEVAYTDLEPQEARVSCLFSDLAGFTQMSERLGPAGTRAILNPYLEVMSVALHRHRGLINKFMGDGIFAFFNAPILLCEQHALSACEAAKDCVLRLDVLKAEQNEHPLAAEFGALRMRIGITSGPAFVGDYGSDTKLDYTCVGDTVNLAARLESANKQFGTSILVDGRTRDDVEDRFVFRSLGRLRVVGHTVGVPVYELVGWSGSVEGAILERVATFERGVAAFARRDWADARQAFESCTERDASDQAAIRYIEQIARLQESPPDDAWDGTIALTEK